MRLASALRRARAGGVVHRHGVGRGRAARARAWPGAGCPSSRCSATASSWPTPSPTPTTGVSSTATSRAPTSSSPPTGAPRSSTSACAGACRARTSRCDHRGARFAHGAGDAGGDARLHGARAVPRPARRRAKRHLGARHRPPRDGGGRAAVPGQDRFRADLRDSQGAAGPAARGHSGTAPGGGRAVPREGPGRAVPARQRREGRARSGAGGRGARRVAGAPAHPTPPLADRAGCGRRGPALLGFALVALNVGGLRSRFGSPASPKAPAITLAVLPFENPGGDVEPGVPTATADAGDDRAARTPAAGVAQSQGARVGDALQEDREGPRPDRTRTRREYLLEGSVQHEAKRVRIWGRSAIKVADQTQVWGSRSTGRRRTSRRCRTKSYRTWRTRLRSSSCRPSGRG